MSDLKSCFEGVKWVFIDLDDTLWDFSQNSSDSLYILYNSEPLIKNAYPSYAEFDEMYHYKNSELWNLYHHGKISQKFLKEERYRWLLNRKRVSCDLSAEASRLNERYLDILGNCKKTIEGAFDLLDYLAPKYMMAILSNGFIDVQYKKLYGSKLDGYFQRMIISDEIGIQKPDVRIFDYALDETGADMDSVVMIGDNPDADIYGAICAGWRTIYFDRKNQGISEDLCPDAIVTDLSEIKNLL